MPESAHDEARTHIGEAIVFWSWLAIIAVGLAVMIFVPLTGR